jgi:arylformamidase
MTRVLRYLSHELDENTPVFGANGPVRISVDADFTTGPYLQHLIQTVNHNGTHVDVPRHFCPEGRTLSDLPADMWHFRHVALADLPVEDDHVVVPADLESVLADVDLLGVEALVFRTGFGVYRRTDPERYLTRNPGFSPESAAWLFAHTPMLRGMFCDIPSYTPYSDMATGIAFHQRALGQGHDDPFIMLFEDVDLSEPMDGIEEIWALPLRLRDLDGAPVTIVAHAY